VVRLTHVLVGVAAAVCGCGQFKNRGWCALVPVVGVRKVVSEQRCACCNIMCDVIQDMLCSSPVAAAVYRDNKKIACCGVGCTLVKISGGSITI
jgi:hypothetical protein